MAKQNLHKFPTVPQNLNSIIKPEELVDVIEMTPLSLHDRRSYNLLIGNAWNTIRERKQHSISRQEITKYVDSKNQDIPATLRNLMSSIVVVKVRNNENGRPETRQIPLLGPNAIEERGPIKYSFPSELIDIIEKTQIFARIHTEVMFALSSKYSLALYEWMQKRINLQYVHYETVSIEEARGLLNVEKGKLSTFGNLNKYAIKPATEEVSFLTEYDVTAEPVKTGRAVTHVKFTWHKKRDVGSQIAAIEELERSKVGRKARMENRVESPAHSETFPQITKSSEILVSSSALEKGKELAIAAGTGWDIYAIQSQYFEHADKKGKPDNPDGAFIGFVKKKIKERP